MSDQRAIINLDPMDPVVLAGGKRRTVILGLKDPGEAVRAVPSLLADGVGSIELCGGFGPLAAAPVVEAVAGRVPVGLAMFGMESLTSVAAYKARAEAGEAMTAAFIVIVPGTDPRTDRVVREHEGGRALFVAVPEESAAPEVAADLLASEGVELIELYGGFSPTGAARVIEAVDAAIPIGLAARA
ncbi:hypothetical protein DP939_34775 [Spongiactinospora rosea]|uniref:Uncharacterized protein n=1 Tax=Spongiactinospora rosea TaxID=2248750 RepID=A0A366LQR4_9ACTN|nr:DUF6506 family protein [Spongiactinospora rosea]RBQ15542.1 hypothetical protein DP939_34775 [Spongiactinospora rosea]